MNTQDNTAEQREFGEQPIAAIMQEHGLTNHDLVTAAPRPITHKMVMKATRGRKLTHHTKLLVLEALNAATQESFRLADLFTY